MKQCPYCGKKFNLWIRATGEYKEHVRECGKSKEIIGDEMSRALACRGCPAGCFDDLDYSKIAKEE